MSSLINLNNIISSFNISDNKQTLQLSEISSELSQAIQTHKTGMLEILAKSDGFDFVLQLGDKHFSVNLKNSLLPTMSTEEKILIPVRLNSSGKITVINDIISKTDSFSKSDIVIETKEGIFQKPTLTPIKLQNFVEQNIKDISVDASVKQKILQIVKDINVSLKTIGGQIDRGIDIENLQNIIKEIVKNPQNIADLKIKLEQTFESLIGKQLPGEISDKINQLYVIKTPMGETFFSSDVKIPLLQKVVLNINSQASVFDQKIKIADELLKNIFPNYKTTSDVNILTQESGFKNLIEVMQNADARIINLLTSKLPFQSNNLFENIYNLYKGIISQDITQWLGSENIKELISDNANAQKHVGELSNMLQNSLKETPSWKIVEMPFFDGSQLSAIKIAIKKDKRSKENKTKEKTARFVVETEFSKLGKFQFDGFSKAKSRNFDLIIRTSSKISDDFCSNIINLFKKSLYDLNYSGTIKINMVENFINFNDEVVVKEGVYI